MLQNTVNRYPDAFGLLYRSAIPIDLTGVTTETELLRLPSILKAASFAENSILRIVAAITLTNNGNNKRFRFRIGSTIVHIRDSVGNTTIVIDQTYQNRNNKKSQINYGSAGGSSLSFGFYNIDTTLDQDFSISGQLNVGTDLARIEAFYLELAS